MHIFDPSQFDALLATYGYGLVLVVVALESAGIPLPGETVLVSAAIYAGATHNMAIAGIVAAATLGAILGDNIGFWVGRKAGQPLLDRYGALVGLDIRRRMLGRYLFQRYGGAGVFFGRFVAILRTFAALLAGVNRFDPLRFLIFNASGAVVWAAVFGFGGYMLGAGFRQIAGPAGVVLAALALAGLIVGWRYCRRHEAELLDEAERAMERAMRAQGAV
ncbi:MAG: DedA family protein [Rhodoblastus sp.]